MENKIFKGMSNWSQLFFLFLFCFGGLVVAIFITIVMGGGAVDKIQSIDFIRVMQIVQSISLFLIPALLYAYLISDKPFSFLKLQKTLDLRFLLPSVLLIMTIQPFISFIGYYNNLISLPESLSGLEEWMRNMENSTALLMERFLKTDSVTILLLNIFIIAILAGITEEFFFRGAMQQIFEKICKSSHVSIWITAFIFSFIHFQFYGFLPRMILGALLGYIFFWSKNLWIPVIVHTINNLLNILIFYFYHGTSTYDKLESIGSGSTWWISVISFVLSFLIMLLLAKKRIRSKQTLSVL